MTIDYGSNALISVRVKLSEWFLTGLGQSLVQIEREHINQVLPDLFGYHILQVGSLAGIDYLPGTRISHRITLLIDQAESRLSDCSIYCSCKSLPVVSDCMDVVVLPHVLEFESNPHQVLREVERSLIGEGYVVIIGFNPWSLWGLWRFILRWWDTAPWCGYFISMARIKDWLSLLDFEIVSTESFYYRPPINRKNLMDRLTFLEKLGHFCCPYLGGAYMIVAKKRVIPLTPVKMQWRARRRMISSGVAEPSTRKVMETYE
jgi:SAM-dependent methyltransferase